MAVVLHQASIQQQLELEQSAVGEVGLLIACVGLCTLACRKKNKQTDKKGLFKFC